MADINELRDFYDTTDQSESIDGAAPRTDRPAEVLVSTSIRLPKSLMDRVRERATDAGVPTTTLMRQWILDRLEGSSTDDEVVSVAELGKFITTHSVHRRAM